MKTTCVILITIAMAIMLLAGCRDATVASHNLSKEADQFRVRRRVIFYNGITDTYMFEMIGNISIETDPSYNELAIIAKVGENQYRKHYLGLSDNVTYIVEQLDYTEVSKYKYELIFKPQSIIPVTVGVE